MRDDGDGDADCEASEDSGDASTLADEQPANKAIAVNAETALIFFNLFPSKNGIVRVDSLEEILP